MNRVFAMSDGNGRLLVSLCWLVTMTTRRVIGKPTLTYVPSWRYAHVTSQTNIPGISICPPAFGTQLGRAAWI
ncbi:hypothetical protein EDD17DRAFT_1531377 [Pisolithus thermaeus]|nr:hypothetical protein EV401DRAFT_2024183 [Pisolithus croceorrhizus]KAI6168015.1 hypothetical protein EDD17DRAFT_1531377 [Pisolithus thermaeus]